MWGRFRGAWAVFAHNRLAVFGLVLVALFALMAVAPPILKATIWSERVYDPVVGYDPAIAFHPAPPSPNHLLGTDALGRDVLSMLLTATRPTFTVAIIAALTAAIIGTAIGAFSAYYRGAVDGGLSYLSDAFLLVPAPIFMVIVGARFIDMQPAMFGLIYGLLAGTSTVAIVMRSHALTLVTKPFIEASQMVGGRGWHIITTHLVPHMLPLAATQMMLTVIGAVVADGFIAFTGIARPHPNWGSMVESAFTFQNVFQTALPWHQLIAPGAALSLFAAAFYFISRGLHEVAEPRLREERV
jgi:ABC-type dipeptide/oligopeptide/nickel transport system permease subunit